MQRGVGADGDGEIERREPGTPLVKRGQAMHAQRVSRQGKAWPEGAAIRPCNGGAVKGICWEGAYAGPQLLHTSCGCTRNSFVNMASRHGLV